MPPSNKQAKRRQRKRRQERQRREKDKLEAFARGDRRAAKMCVGKVAYASEDAATVAAIRAMKARHLPLRWYRCPICGSYHLTSRPRG